MFSDVKFAIWVMLVAILASLLFTNGWLRRIHEDLQRIEERQK